MGNRRYLLGLAACVLLGLALRLVQLDFQPLWWDEGYSVWFATHPPAQMAALTAEDIHPPLYYALLHGWIGLLGARPVSLRLVSVLCGVLAIPAIYAAGRRFFGSRHGLLAALLLAINPLHIYYSQEVRMYGLVALLSVGVLVAAWEVQWRAAAAASGHSRGAGRWWPAYVLLVAAALYTQYYAVFLPIGLSVYALWHWRRDGVAATRWLAAQAVAALLYLPWVLYAAPKLTLYVSQKVVQDADRPLGPLEYLARHLAAFLAGHLTGPLTPYWPLALLALLPLVLIPLRWWRDRQMGTPRSPATPAALPISGSAAPSSAAMLGVVLLTALALGWLIGLRYPFFPEHGERLLLLALPAFLLLLAAALITLWQHARPAALVIAALLAGMSAASLAAFYTVPRYPGDDYRPLIARTVELGQPEDTVFAIYPWQVGYWRAYGSPAGPTAELTPDADWTPAVAARLDTALARGKVWFPAHLALGAILETKVEDYLADRSVAFINEWYGPGTRLSGWAVTPSADQIVAPAVRFPLRGVNAEVTLIEAAVARGPTPAVNAVAAVRLRWRGIVAAPTLGASIRLVDDIGQIWAQHDYEPLGIARCRSSAAGPSSGRGTDEPRQDARSAASVAEDCLGLLIPAGTPPGRYFVDVIVQPKGDARPLDVVAADGRVLGTAARLAELMVAPADRALGVERLPIGTHMTFDFADGLRVLGYTVEARPIAPGETRPVNLFWQATGQPSADYVAFVQVLDGAGQVASGWEAPPGGPYATTAWTAATLMRTQATIRPRADLPDGRYPLIAGLFRSDDKARLRTTDGADHIVLGQITVRGRPHERTPPQPQHPTDVAFGTVGRLIGYDLTTPAAGLQPGATLSLTLYWQAVAATERPLTVFVHLVSETGDIRGYGDSEPGLGRLPTTSWLTGEYLTDPHQVSVDAAAAPGPYRLRIGLYDRTTGQRLPTPDGRDHAEIGPVMLGTP